MMEHLAFLREQSDRDIAKMRNILKEVERLLSGEGDALSNFRLEPKLELDGTRYAWTLVIELDPDWQDVSLGNETPLGYMTFKVHVSDEWLTDGKLVISPVEPDIV